MQLNGVVARVRFGHDCLIPCQDTHNCTHTSSIKRRETAGIPGHCAWSHDTEVHLNGLKRLTQLLWDKPVLHLYFESVFDSLNYHWKSPKGTLYYTKVALAGSWNLMQFSVMFHLSIIFVSDVSPKILRRNRHKWDNCCYWAIKWMWITKIGSSVLEKNLMRNTGISEQFETMLRCLL